MLSLFPDVYIKWQKLSEESCHEKFKPSRTTSSSGQDELVIPDTELQRIHRLGRKFFDVELLLRVWVKFFQIFFMFGIPKSVNGNCNLICALRPPRHKEFYFYTEPNSFQLNIGMKLAHCNYQ